MTVRIITAALVSALLGAAVPARADTTLTETGSTLILPLFKAWAADYAASHPGVTVTTEGTGSAEGIDKALAGAVEIGTSDAYLSDDQADQHPTLVDVPMAISAVTLAYDLPDLKAALKLDGPTLAGIYDGSIKFWDDKAIGAMNPGVALPHDAIVPVHRAEGSGDTFVFTQYLTFTTSPRDEDTSTVVRLPGASWGDKIGYGTKVQWPETGGGSRSQGQRGHGRRPRQDALFGRVCRCELRGGARGRQARHRRHQELLGTVPARHALHDRGGRRLAHTAHARRRND